MKHLRLALVVAIGVALGGCSLFSKISDAIGTVNSVGVTQTQAYVARTGFVAAQKTATNYLNFCTDNAAKNYSACDRGAQATVVSAIRSGRVARDELKKYMAQCPGDGACARPLYDKLVSVTNTINGIAGQVKGGGN